MITVFLNHLLALRMAGETSGSRRKWPLAAAVLINLSFLIYFKYYNFISGATNDLLIFTGMHPVLPVLNVILPVGISFYTFQITAYIVDVYRRRIPAERSFADLLLFTVYFPQLVAGPIERASDLMPLLKNPGRPKGTQIQEGLLLVLRGLFKKIYVADNISPYVDLALLPGSPSPAAGHLFTGIVFALQIYADFSGYTDLARGLSRMAGIELSENFDLPFFSTNPGELWRKWHMTLMTFLRDYVYIPLGGSAGSTLRKYGNVFLVFIVSGVWHGAGFEFLLWGAYSGILVILYESLAPLIRRVRQKYPVIRIPLAITGGLFTFLTFAVGTLMIRMHTWPLFHEVFTHLLPAPGHSPLPPISGLLAIYILPLLLLDLYQKFSNRPEPARFSSNARFAFIVASSLLLILLGAFQGEQFYYFQF